MTRRMVGNATRHTRVGAIRPRPAPPRRPPAPTGPPHLSLETLVHPWPIVRLKGPFHIRILLVPSPTVAYRREREVAMCVLSVFDIANSLVCPATPAHLGCERRTHVARRLTGPTRTGRARRGRRSSIRRLRPDLPALCVGDDQLF